ncbi:hypothetical protein DPMN_074129 [Dreissena polymorpha]|uniref:Uncharacterized protein n=1 Tax=Dreissena polymorpha TaxID=45954 RepID=A0A9D3YH33_DREPO|nr:hypothetical protein DPMN_074129 [Dreissena polymorpha]
MAHMTPGGDFKPTLPIKPTILCLTPLTSIMGRWLSWATTCLKLSRSGSIATRWVLKVIVTCMDLMKTEGMHIRWEGYGHKMVEDFVEKDELGIYASVLQGAQVDCILQLCDTGVMGDDFGLCGKDSSPF